MKQRRKAGKHKAQEAKYSNSRDYWGKERVRFAARGKTVVACDALRCDARARHMPASVVEFETLVLLFPVEIKRFWIWNTNYEASHLLVRNHGLRSLAGPRDFLFKNRGPGVQKSTPRTFFFSFLPFRQQAQQPQVLPAVSYGACKKKWHVNFFGNS